MWIFVGQCFKNIFMTVDNLYFIWNWSKIFLQNVVGRRENLVCPALIERWYDGISFNFSFSILGRTNWKILYLNLDKKEKLKQCKKVSQLFVTFKIQKPAICIFRNIIFAIYHRNGNLYSSSFTPERFVGWVGWAQFLARFFAVWAWHSGPENKLIWISLVACKY